MLVDVDALKQKKMALASMEEDRQPWFNYWRELADFILPRRYTSLQTTNERNKATNLRNPNILDGTATMAAQVLASGMLNGITSPARPWFRFRATNMPDEGPLRIWLDDVQARMAYVLAESNFYGAMATVYLDLSCFSTAAMFIYEDDEDVFRCYNFALGEYYFLQNERGVVDRVGYEFRWRVEQVVKRFGLENCSDFVKEAWDKKGARWNDKVDIACLIEPNDDGPFKLANVFKFRQIFWEKNAGNRTTREGLILEQKGFREWPGVCPRWMTIANDPYGNGPSFDALGDIKQLQHETKKKAQALDKMISPPMVADASLANRRIALLPNGITFVSGLSNNEGIRPVYQIAFPVQDLTQDILAVQERIREFFYNDLFKMISQLDTVRSATEVNERVEEKLVLLGPVLERFENEALNPSLRRIFSIMLRKGLLAPPPPGIEAANIEIQYVSILNDAQRAVGAAPLERFAAYIGSLSAIAPEVLAVPNFTEMSLDMADRLGVPSKDVFTRDEIAEKNEAQAQEQSIANLASVAPDLAAAGKNLAETPVGGATDALSLMTGM